MSRDSDDHVSRRDAVRTMAGLVAAPALIGLARKGHVIAGRFVDDAGAAGHRVRDGKHTVPASTQSAQTRRTRVAIVGGGIGGLSAGWRLDALGMHDWVLLELEGITGGNARSASYPGLDGRRAPWGAHYLPVPDKDAVHVRALLRELGVLQADGQWDERVLCHAPHERVFQHGRWHEGLAPLDAAPAAVRAEFDQFAARIAEWRASGLFRVPSAMGHAARRRMATGTAAERALWRDANALDAMTADAWLAREGWRSPALRWWVEYGTRDDYGASLTQASAWAAVHYFAARPDDADDEGPLTWPEGNDFLARQLATRLQRRAAADGQARVITSAPAYRMEALGSTRWRVHTPQGTVDADVVIWAAPTFVLPRVLLSAAPMPAQTEYAPWVVANLVLDGAPRDTGSRPGRDSGTNPAWDNVLVDSTSLGYVNASHQLLQQHAGPPIWTWYHALVEGSAAEARRDLLQRPWGHWRDTIVSDLSRAHPDIAERLVRIDVMRWGHAMARPTPGVLGRHDAMADWQPAPRVHLAHADVSGFSLFEEAQWHGVRAAEQAVRELGGRR